MDSSSDPAVLARSMAAVAAVLDIPPDDVDAYFVLIWDESGPRRIGTNTCCDQHLVMTLRKTADIIEAGQALDPC